MYYILIIYIPFLVIHLKEIVSSSVHCKYKTYLAAYLPFLMRNKHIFKFVNIINKDVLKKLLTGGAPVHSQSSLHPRHNCPSTEIYLSLCTQAMKYIPSSVVLRYYNHLLSLTFKYVYYSTYYCSLLLPTYWYQRSLFSCKMFICFARIEVIVIQPYSDDL